MKSKVLFAVLLLASVHAFADTDVNGQPTSTARNAYSTYPDRGVVNRITPQVALVESTLVNRDGSTDFKYKSGLAAGVTADIGTSNVVLETGAVYKQLGTAVEGFGQTANLNLNYVTVPVLAKYYFSPEPTTAFIKVGALPSFLVGKGNTAAVGGLIFDEPNTFDLGAQAGLGGRIALGGGADLMLEATYARGFSKVFTNNAEIYNSAFGATAGLGIAL